MVTQKQLNDMLIKAAEKDKFESVVVLLELGANVHAKNDSALRMAVMNGHLEVVRELLKAGADVHVENDRMLREAAANGYLEIVRELLKAGADVHASNDLALRWATSFRRPEVINLLKSYMTPEVETICTSKEIPIVTQEQLNGKFLNAVQTGKLQAISLLLEIGADVHVENDLALREAARNGHLEVVELLLSYSKSPANVLLNRKIIIIYDGQVVEVPKKVLQDIVDTCKPVK